MAHDPLLAARSAWLGEMAFRAGWLAARNQCQTAPRQPDCASRLRNVMTVGAA